MKSFLFTLALVLSLAACTSSPPKPPEPKGDKTKVNPIDVNITDLKNKDYKI
tara:strand:- start:215 stop:370 length:156 start_codon:yes stop_codon:yes gene_type:complete